MQRRVAECVDSGVGSKSILECIVLPPEVFKRGILECIVLFINEHHALHL
jgi:hypothetical protein